MHKQDRIFVGGDFIRWGVVLALMIVDAIWLAQTHRSIEPASLISTVIPVSALATLAGMLFLLDRMQWFVASRFRNPLSNVATCLHCVALLVAFSNVTAILQYLLIALAPPLIDQDLAELDARMGFHWPLVYEWVRSRPPITRLLHLAYLSGMVQLVTIPVVIGLKGKTGYLRELVSLIMLSSILTILIAGVYPAGEAYSFYGLASPSELHTISHFEMLRNGSLRVFRPGEMQGLVSIPSFHTIMALLFIQSMRWTRCGFWLVFLLNALMILSTITEGGHYLIDIFGGIALWAVSVGLMHLFTIRRSAPVPSHGTKPQVN